MCVILFVILNIHIFESPYKVIDSRTGMLPADSIGKPKIKNKTEKSYGAGDQLLGEFIEKQRNGTRLKFSQICHEFGSKIQHTNFEDFWPFWIVKGFPFLERRIAVAQTYYTF